jgi:hypothetical protein
MFKITVKTLGGSTTESRRQKFYQAVGLCEKVLKSQGFADWFTLQAEKKKFSQLTQHQQSLGEYKLFLQTQKEVKFDYYIQYKPWYKRFTSVIGWTVGDDIVTYADQFDGMSMAGLASHLAHESMHLLGFTHSVRWTKERDDSAPYAIGNYVEEEVRKMIANGI